MIFKGQLGPFYITNDTKILFFEPASPPHMGKTHIRITTFDIYVNDTLEEVAEIVKQGHKDWYEAKIL